MKLTNTYYATRRDQILIVANSITIIICAVGSIWGMIRIGELKAEQEKLGAAIEWLELGNRLADQVLIATNGRAVISGVKEVIQ